MLKNLIIVIHLSGLPLKFQEKKQNQKQVLILRIIVAVRFPTQIDLIRSLKTGYNMFV